MYTVNILGETQKDLTPQDKDILAQKLRELLKKYNVELAYLNVEEWSK